MLFLRNTEGNESPGCRFTYMYGLWMAEGEVSYTYEGDRIVDDISFSIQ